MALARWFGAKKLSRRCCDCCSLKFRFDRYAERDCHCFLTKDSRHHIGSSYISWRKRNGRCKHNSVITCIAAPQSHCQKLKPCITQFVETSPKTYRTGRTPPDHVDDHPSYQGKMMTIFRRYSNGIQRPISLLVEENTNVSFVDFCAISK
jgi:hypothetical protein